MAQRHKPMDPQNLAGRESAKASSAAFWGDDFEQYQYNPFIYIYNVMCKYDIYTLYGIYIYV